MALGTEIEYAVSVDFRDPEDSSGNRKHELLTEPAYGVLNGVMRLATGKNALVEGSETFSAALLQRNAFSKVFSYVDITETGNYSTFAKLNVKLDNTSGLHSWLRLNEVFLKNCLVKFYVIIGSTFHQKWTGEVDDDPWDRTTYQLKCVDLFRSMHKQTPGKFINQSALGSDVPAESQGEAIPRVFGYVQDAKLLPIASEETASGFIFSYRKDQVNVSKSTTTSILGFIRDPIYSEIPLNNFSTIVIARGTEPPDFFNWDGSTIRAIYGGGAGEVYNIVASDTLTKVWSTTPVAGSSHMHGQAVTLDRPWDFSVDNSAEDLNVFVGEWEQGFLNYQQNMEVTHWGFLWKYMASAGGSTIEPGKTYGTSAVLSPWQMISVITTSLVPYNSNVPYVNGVPMLTENQKYLFYDKFRDTVVDNEDATLIRASYYNSVFIASDGVVSAFRKKLSETQNPIRVIKENVPAYTHSMRHLYYYGDLVGSQFSGIALGDVSILPDNKYEITGSLWAVRSADVQVGYALTLTDLLNTIRGVLNPYYSGFKRDEFGFYKDAKFALMAPNLRDAVSDYDFNTSAGSTLWYTYAALDYNGNFYQESKEGTIPSMMNGRDPSYFRASNRIAIKNTYRIEDFDFNFENILRVFEGLEFDLLVDCYSTAPVDITVNVSVITTVKTTTGQYIELKQLEGTTKITDIPDSGDYTIPQRTAYRLTTFPNTARDSSTTAINLTQISNSGKELSELLKGTDVRNWVSDISVMTVISVINESKVRLGVDIFEAQILAQRQIEGDTLGCGVLGPAVADSSSQPTGFGDVIYDIMRTYDEVPISEIDSQSFADVSLSRLTNDMVVLPQRQITENKNSIDYIIELLRQSMLMLVPDDLGRRKLVDWLNNKTPIATHSTLGDAVLLNARNILDDSIGPLNRVATTKVYSTAELRFHYSNLTDEFESSINVTNTDKDTFPSYQSYETEISQTVDPVNGVRITDNSSNWRTLGFKGRFNAVIAFDPQTAVGSPPTNCKYKIFLNNGESAIYIFEKYSPRQQFQGRESITLYSENDVDTPITAVGVAILYNVFQLLGGKKWQNYVTGVDDRDYAFAKKVWENYHRGYLRTKSLNPLPTTLSECKWLSHSLTDKTDYFNALTYLYVLSQWVCFPKQQIKYLVDIEPNVDLSIGDCVSFLDPQFTEGVPRVGWIVNQGVITDSNKFELTVLLDKDPLDPYNEAVDIDEGVDYNGSLVGNVFDSIDEDDLAAIDEIDEGIV